MSKLDKQTVLVGLGGTGSRVVNNVARMLQERDIAINDGTVTCVVMDTNQSDNKKIKASGTDIPVVPTCDERLIDEYFARYINMRINEWCPYTPSFGQQTMIDGASEIRVKSRIAFMDTIESGKIQQFRNVVEKAFHNRPGKPEKIRVMIVSSLSGGTGSGMFLQTALWLRKFFKEKKVVATIRGIMLLPDVFINTVPNIRNNPTKPLYHYANAYAAIRELNAINKVVKGKITLPKPMVIDGLFDSRKPPQQPVFDNAFFIDSTAQGGASFNDLKTYEQLVAHSVFMQLYAPMQDEMVSVEDNLYRAFETNPEPVYGSCGTSCAEYPVDDVIDYCSIRAAQDAIQMGWTGLDKEIGDEKAQFESEQMDGINLDRQYDARGRYIELFDERANKKGTAIGPGDRLFVSMKKDVLNQIRESDQPDAPVQTSCKVVDFMEHVAEMIKNKVQTMEEFNVVARIRKRLPDPQKPENFPDDPKKEYAGLRDSEKKAVDKALEQFDEVKEDVARALVRELFPLDMGSLNVNNANTVYSLFQRVDTNGDKTIVHPIAARYLLYKLSKAISEARKANISPEVARKAAIKGDTKVSFDNKKTLRTETLETYWEDCGWIISKAEIAHFIKRYQEFNIGNEALCHKYGVCALTQLVLQQLGEYVNGLIGELEDLFKSFDKLSKKLGADLEDNVKKNEETISNVMYVYAKREHKEAMYKSLCLDPMTDNSALNANVIKSVYGSYCAIVRPSVDANQPYAETSILGIIYRALKDSYVELIGNDKKYSDKVHMSVIAAMYAESDFEWDKAKPGKKSKNTFDEEEFETTGAQKRANRYRDKVEEYKIQLEMKAAPFLQAHPDEYQGEYDWSKVSGAGREANGSIWMTTASGKKIYMPHQNQLTFWGYNGELSEECSGLSTILGAHEDTATDDDYLNTELYCYRSIYGVTASRIPKFNEKEGGAYYENYSAVINSLIESGSELVTPHLDKHWHEFLPYISDSFEETAQGDFGKTFWRAIGYRRITLDNHGNYQLALTETTSAGKLVDKIVPLVDGLGNSIESTDICRLVEALRSHAAFNAQVTKELEELYVEDIRGNTQFKNCKLFRNLLENEEINPITLMGKFQRSRRYDPSVKVDLLSHLEVMVEDMADNLDVNRTAKDSVKTATFKQLYKLYDASKAANKEAVVRESKWMEIFVDCGLISQSAADEAKAKATAAANADEDTDE